MMSHECSISRGKLTKLGRILCHHNVCVFSESYLDRGQCKNVILYQLFYATFTQYNHHSSRRSYWSKSYQYSNIQRAAPFQHNCNESLSTVFIRQGCFILIHSYTKDSWFIHTPRMLHSDGMYLTIHRCNAIAVRAVIGLVSTYKVTGVLPVA